MARSDSVPKLSSPAASGAYNNYYKADREAKANPSGYSTASNAISQALSQGGYPASWFKPVMELVARESSFNSSAKNPKSSASGLFQFLDSTRKNYGGGSVNWNDPYQQAVAGLKYIADRYGSPEKALSFWDQNNWY